MSVELFGPLIFKLAFMAALGYFMRKRGIINGEFQKTLSSVLLKVIIPVNVIAVGNTVYDPTMAASLLWAALIVLLYYASALLLTAGLRRALPLSPGKNAMLACIIMLANVGYIGFPIVNEVYGGEGMLYTIIFNLGFQFIAFTFGVRLMGDKITPRSFLTSPMTLAPVLAILIFVSPFRLPGFIVSAFSEVGGLSAAFSMFILGSSLAGVRFASLWTDGWAWLATAIRQVVYPLAAAGLLWLAGFRGILPATMVLLCGMPSGTINLIFAQQYNTELPFATRAVSQGSVLMVVTLPLCILLNSLLFF